jgi:hypothetical protein
LEISQNIVAFSEYMNFKNHSSFQMHGGGGYDYSRLPPPGAAGPDRDMGFMPPDHPATSVGILGPDYMETPPPVGTTPSSLEAASSAPPLPPAPISDSYTLTSLDCGSCES